MLPCRYFETFSKWRRCKAAVLTRSTCILITNEVTNGNISIDPRSPNGKEVRSSRCDVRSSGAKVVGRGRRYHHSSGREGQNMIAQDGSWQEDTITARASGPREEKYDSSGWRGKRCQQSSGLWPSRGNTIAQTAWQTIPTELGPLALTNNTIAQDGRSRGCATQLGPGALARRNTIAQDGHGAKIPTPPRT